MLSGEKHILSQMWIIFYFQEVKAVCTKAVRMAFILLCNITDSKYDRCFMIILYDIVQDFSLSKNTADLQLLIISSIDYSANHFIISFFYKCINNSNVFSHYSPY